MKNFLAVIPSVTALAVTALSLFTGTAFAHSGHIANNNVHAMLHSEHIIALVAIGLLAYIIKSLNRK